MAKATDSGQNIAIHLEDLTLIVPASEQYLQVAIPVPMRQSFTYLLPATLAGNPIQIGERVIVPFGPRQLIGIVLSVSDTLTNSDIDAAKLKAIIGRVSDNYRLNDKLLTLLKQAASYYHHPIGDVIQQSLPVLLRKIEQPNLAPELVYHCQQELPPEALTKLEKKAPKQAQLYQLLSQHPKLSWPELRTLAYSKAQLNALIDKDIVAQAPRELKPYQYCADDINCDNKHTLSAEQAVIVAGLKQRLNQFSCHLVEGVTGSGKTEVYLQTIEAVLANDKQVLILVPEIGLTPQTLSRFEQRFSVPIYLHHSALNDTERLTTWLAAHNDQAAIVLGTRSAVFSPLNKLGLIIIDEEHDGSFKQQDSFRYHARDIAILRAKQLNIPIVLGSATPSLESLQNGLSGKYIHHQLLSRAGVSQQAKLALLNVAEQQMDNGLSGSLIAAMKQTLAKNEQVLVFLNRRGYAPALSCNECHWRADCLRCNKPYTLHFGAQQLICHHCGDQQYLPRQCPSCGSIRLSGLGLGTEQLELKLAELFPEHSVVRIDRDSTKRKGELAKRLQAINDKEHHILLGTQMLAKGHHFPNVTLVAILEVDSALFSFDFRAPEHMAQLLIQVAGRSGRASKPGQVLIQSQYPEHPLLQDLVNNGYQHFARYALTERQQAQLPPHSFQALIRADANYPSYPEKFLTDVANQFRQQTAIQAVDCWLAGPMPAAMEKKAGKYRYHLLVQAKSRKLRHRAITELLAIAPSSESHNKVRWSVDIDPLELTW
ncbi:primosomal protein N' [Endozoicomonas sp. G2_1]|uniref:primosomal protein N' n=1 Tax=Endozoicomonas sp. G2_1 TaxID=2821091 RepID=UPI001ADAFE11|nr:primosomal protein N' [Endozoicomonas sp. G2_1]MBO9490934.1 primosomal protein N' [Endozoicomonas sp. G2_1]